MRSPGNEDDTLFAQFAQNRNETSFRALYRHYTPRLFALATRLTGSRAEAEEITQDAWVRAIERHDRFAGKSRYSTWLIGILVNCWRESSRRAQRVSDRETDAVSPDTSPGTARDLERALLALPQGFREIVLLHDVYGLTHKEIAGMLGIEPGTSKSQLARGRARLREWLEAPMQDAKNEGGQA